MRNISEKLKAMNLNKEVKLGSIRIMKIEGE